MKQKTILLLFLLGMLPILNYSQSLDSSFCTTTTVSENFSLMENVRIPDYSNYIFGVKVYVHVLTHSEYGPGQSVLGVNEAMKRLYEDFDAIDIHLIWDGDIDYILNDNWHDTPSAYKSLIWDHNYHTDGIDIYLGNGISNDFLAEAASIGGKTSFIVNGFWGAAANNDFTFIAQSGIITHELGHVLFLWHTFHGTAEAGNCAECLYETGASGNANGCGDYVFDTPPDPDNGFDINCNYFAGGQDECGNDFQPLGDNFMAYGPIHCKSNFTLGQKRRMKNALTLIPELQQTVVQDYTYIRGKNIICYFDADYKIYNNDTSTITIEHSNSISITTDSQTSTQINLIVNNEFPFPEYKEGRPAWIVVKQGGIEVAKKNFWVGTPQFMEDNSIEGEINVSPNDIEDYYVSERLEGASTYNWVFPGEPAEQVDEYTLNQVFWQYDYKTSHYNILNTMIGKCGGELFIYGINECGDRDDFNVGEGLNVNVSGSYPNCDDDLPGGIIYYPNPTSSLLAVDLSLQAYKTFTLRIFNDLQVLVNETQCTNIVKTIDTSNLPNGNYYLHVYDGSELLLNKTLIINH